jgi:hypothetical protein
MVVGSVFLVSVDTGETCGELFGRGLGNNVWVCGFGFLLSVFLRELGG